MEECKIEKVWHSQRVETGAVFESQVQELNLTAIFVGYDQKICKRSGSNPTLKQQIPGASFLDILLQGRIQKFFEGGVLKFFCMDGKILGVFGFFSSSKTLAN